MSPECPNCGYILDEVCQKCYENPVYTVSSVILVEITKISKGKDGCIYITLSRPDWVNYPTAILSEVDEDESK